MLDHQQPQDDLNRCRWSSGPQGLRPTLSEVGLDLLEQVVVFEQSIQFSQLRLETQFECRHQREQVDRRVPVS